MKIFIVVLPWDYTTADICGVYKTLEEAKEELIRVRREEQNGGYASLVAAEV